MESLAVDIALDVLDRELEYIAKLLATLAGEDICEESLKGVVFDDMIRNIQTNAPTLWKMLLTLAYTPSQDKQNTDKNPRKVSK